MKKTIGLALLLICLFSALCKAQPEYYNWNFGYNASLNFSTGVPVPQAGSALINWSSSATISDANGNMLFYTDGINVWNKNNSLMPNGTGLYGNIYVPQTCLILKKPGIQEIYYVFTNGNYSPHPGLHYSIVDMSLDSGLGDVTNKNILVNDSIGNCLTAVTQCNGTDYWILTLKFLTKTFYAFSFTDSGISFTPITSILATNANWGPITESPNGNKLVCGSGYGDSTYLYSFNKLTGQISNAKRLNCGAHGGTGVFCEFSPDNAKLYVSLCNRYDFSTTPPTHYYLMYQFDVTSNNANTINASRYTVTETTNELMRTQEIRLAPDNKIYVASGQNQSTISVINNPNASGAACGFASNTISVSPGLAQFAFPHSARAVHAATIVYNTAQDINFCQNELLLDAGAGAIFYEWSTGVHTQTITVDSSATYWVRKTMNASCSNTVIVDTFNVTLTQAVNINLGNDTTLCQGQTLTLALNIPSATYEWQDGNTSNTYPVMQQGIYAVEASSNGCISRDTILVNFDTPAMLDLGADTTLCSGQILTLSVANTNANLLWQDNSTNNSFTVNQQGIYWLNAANSCGLNSDTIQVNYAAAPALALGNDTSLCQGQTLNLDVNTSNVISYLWQDSVFGATYNITQQGTYWVALASNCGIVSDTIQVNFIATPFVNLGNDTTLCPGQNITLDVSDAAIDSYHWQDNSSAATFNINQQGSYYVDVLNNCGVASDTIHVTYDGLPFVYLGNDTTLCDGNTLLLNASTNNATYQWQDNSTNATFAISQQGLYWVNAIAVCGIVSDTIQVNYNPAPVVNLGNDTTLCLGQNLSLDATLSNATYLWQDNDSSATYNITQQGTYWLNVTLNNCTTRDSIIVNYNNALPVVDLGNDTTLCEGQSITLDASSPSATYLWQDNSTLPTLIATQQGTYLIQVANGCGVAIDSIHLYMNQLPQLALSTIISPSCYGLSNGSATVTAQGTGVLTYVWDAGLANGPIINQVSSGTYSVAVYDANNCSNAMYVTINEPDSISAIITSINATCAINNGSAQINASGGTGTLTYLWNNNASSASISELSEGNYAVIVTDSLACVKVLQTSITQSGIFSIDAGVDQEINYGSTVELIGLGPENATYSWSPIDYLTCSECATTIANPVLTTEYILTVLKDGCIVTDTLIVKVDVKCGDVFIPSAFSPNSDDVNNILEVRGNCITQFSFKVFDRWGEIIFESNDQNTGWDGTFKGKPMNEGVYIYTLAAIVKGENIFQKGNVTLMRN